MTFFSYFCKLLFLMYLGNHKQILITKTIKKQNNAKIKNEIRC